MSYVGNETGMLAIWIEHRLQNASAALDALGWTIKGVPLSQRVYPDVAPANIAYPYIVYQPQVLPEVIRGVGSEEVMTDTIYVVKAVAQGSDDTVVGPVSAVIHNALVESYGEEVSGGIGDVYMSRRVQVVRYTETAQGSQFRHLGGAYQIQSRAA